MDTPTQHRARDREKRQKKLERYPIKFCDSRKCGKRLVPKEDAWGRLEPLAHFEKRRGCNRTCGGAIRSQDRASVRLDENQLKPPSNPSSAQPYTKASSKSDMLDVDTRRLLKQALRLHDPDLLQAWPSMLGEPKGARRRTLRLTLDERGGT